MTALHMKCFFGFEVLISLKYINHRRDTGVDNLKFSMDQ